MIRTRLKEIQEWVAIMVFAILAGTILSGCARYAKDIDPLYQPVVSVRSGGGDLYIVIPENQKSPSDKVRWVLGSVTDYENKKIDSLTSPRSAAEMVRAAMEQELKRAGYTVFPHSDNKKQKAHLLTIVKADITLDQHSDLADIKATCRIMLDVDIYKDGLFVRKQQYQASSSKTDIKDRDLLARAVLDEAMQGLMQNVVPSIMQQLDK